MSFHFTEPFEVTGDISLQDADALIWGTDVKLFRDGAWELALRDGVNDMFFYVYATFTDAANYERLAMYAGGSGDFFIEAQEAGTGQNDINLAIITAGNGNLTLGPATIGNGGVQVRKSNSYNTQIGPNGARYTMQVARSASGVLASGSTFTFTNIIPAGVWVKAIYSIVTASITGATSYDVGDGVDPDRWAAAVPISIGNSSDPSDYSVGESMFFNGAISDVVLTANGADFTAGEVTVAVIFETYSAGGLS